MIETQLKRLGSVAISCSCLMAIQELSGDLGQYQGSFPGGLGIVAANFQGQIR